MWDTHGKRVKQPVSLIQPFMKQFMGMLLSEPLMHGTVDTG